MKKVILLLAILPLFGTACRPAADTGLTAENIQTALLKTAKQFGWSEDIVSKEPNEENFYSNSLVLYGPVKESGLENLVDNLEIMQFSSSDKAQEVYRADTCLKGDGKPIIVAGIDGCCLNDNKKEISRAILIKDKFVFRSITYFRAECGAAEYLKNLWKNL